MNKSEEYRRIAAECVDMAATADGHQFKAILIDLAGAWLQLALRSLTSNDADPVDVPGRTIREGQSNGLADIERAAPSGGYREAEPLACIFNAEVGSFNHFSRVRDV